jgi:hypothetical protein
LLEQLTVIYPSEQWLEASRGVLSARLAREFPSIFVGFDTEAKGAAPLLHATEWDGADFDAWNFDVSLDELAREPFTLLIADDGQSRPDFPLEVLNRCQRHIGRRNRHSQGQLFDRVLRRHRRLHDLAKPLVRADYNHALDVWQWMLRLDPNASGAAQLAALFHDVERLVSEPDARVEHLAADYQQFKDAHAAGGVAMTATELTAAGVDAMTVARVSELVAAHERSSEEAEVALLNDADALSFFSLNSHGYASYFGPEQTRKKVAYTWHRMRPSARAKLDGVALRGDVRALLAEVSVMRSDG